MAWRLMQLVDADLIRHQGDPTGARYAFKHALVQNAAYHSLLKSQRRSHHQRVAETLEREFGELAEQQPELLAYHFLEAGAAAKALPYLEKAGQRAVQRSAHSDAITHYRKAIDLVAAGEDSGDRARKELSLRLALGAPLMAKKGYAHADVEANYARALELVAGWVTTRRSSSPRWACGSFSRRRANCGRSRAWRAAHGASAGGPRRHVNHAGPSIARDEPDAFRRPRTGVRTHRGRLEALRAGKARQARVQVRARPRRGARLVSRDHPVAPRSRRRGMEASSNALALAEELKHPMSIAFALCYSGVVENMRGEYTQARRHAAAGRERRQSISSLCGWR